MQKYTMKPTVYNFTVDLPSTDSLLTLFYFILFYPYPNIKHLSIPRLSLPQSYTCPSPRIRCSFFPLQTLPNPNQIKNLKFHILANVLQYLKFL